MAPSGSLTRKSDAPRPLFVVQRVGTPSPTRCHPRPRRFCTSLSRHSQSGLTGIRPSSGAAVAGDLIRRAVIVVKARYRPVSNRPSN